LLKQVFNELIFSMFLEDFELFYFNMLEHILVH